MLIFNTKSTFIKTPYIHRLYIILILFLFQSACQSYNDRFHKTDDYSEDSNNYNYSDIRYYRVAGKNQKVMKSDYDKNNILRKETFYRDEKPFKVKLYNESGEIYREDKYKGNPTKGSRVHYYLNGKIKEKFDYHKIDVKHGRYINYFSDGGTKSDLEYKDGNMTGTCSWYYPSGKLLRINEYLTDSYYQIEFYENGERKSEGSFVDDNIKGRWIFYNLDGSISSEMIF